MINENDFLLYFYTLKDFMEGSWMKHLVPILENGWKKYCKITITCWKKSNEDESETGDQWTYSLLYSLGVKTEIRN